ncbi:pirin family protein [candidate division KSB3 bacterium]|uniref:Pirin family protein n=1 Tax=candidate division KSB3 bacterium TaxID=2044937 RepID=A0A9D5JS22_9BACT|nr:pirin family protein [candidate division KSB3 bacterium]MBD3323138.1 pirin family protein [candidate division KSB3 bacterium]
MATRREIHQILASTPTIEGAGVHLQRVFGYPEVPQFDPFLLLDDFHSDNPEDYQAGFPWHPHRGIETVTYMLHGKVRHEDSIGNRGVIQRGDMQWMTAGSGIIHQEMPEQDDGVLWGLQLWVNLPASHKMMPPRYQEIADAHIPEISLQDNVTVRVLCGTVGDVQGPVRGIVVDPEYLDVTVPADTTFEHPISQGYTAFAYVLEGHGYFDHARQHLIPPEHLVLFTDGDHVQITTEADSVRFLLISGKPLKEPVAWYGPIVMNTNEELQQAFEEYRNGTFIQSH